MIPRGSIASEVTSALLALVMLFVWVQYHQRRKVTPQQQHRKDFIAWELDHGRNPHYTLPESCGMVLMAFVFGVSVLVLLRSLVLLLAAAYHYLSSAL